MEIHRENAGRRFRGKHFVRACEVEMHMDMSQEPFCVEIYSKNAGRSGDHLDQTPGLNPHRKNLQGGHSVWGKMKPPIKKMLAKAAGKNIPPAFGLNH